MKQFLVYLKNKIKLILVLLLFGIIFLVCFILYKLPAAAVLYPALVCAILGVIFIIIDYLHVKEKHEKLEEIKKLSASVITQLPEIKTKIEADYQDIINNLIDEARKIETDNSREYNEMIEYYTVWAHQIKTPIASMRLLLEDDDSSKARRLSIQLSKIEQYADMVLAYLRLDSVSSDYVFKKYELDEIIKASIRRFSLDFIEKKLRLEYVPTEKTIVTDEKWFGFVLNQILSNALKYTRKGCVRIYLSDANLLCVEDTGIGILEEDLPRIFEKGYTGRNGRIDARASGIGLYLCRRICKNLGFKISAESKPDCGTTIYIDINQGESAHPYITKM